MGKTKSLLLATTLLSAGSVSPAGAWEGFVDIGSIPGTSYSLSVHRSTQTCNASAQFANGAMVSMGHIDQQWVLFLGHIRWRLEAGRDYDYRLTIDGEPFSGSGLATQNFINSPMSKEFMRAFTAGRSMTIHDVSGAAVATISLAGTARVAEAVRECEQKLMSYVRRQQQPFGPPRSSTKPDAPLAPSQPAPATVVGPQWDS